MDVRLEDFTRAEAPTEPEQFNLLICNPPYVRHHHIEHGEKQRLKARTQAACGVEITGLAGLYCYFLALCHAWMANGGLAGWLIPSEFMDVNYGVCVKRYLLNKVMLRHIHRFDPNEVQFGDALVSSALVWFSKEKTPRDHAVRFTYGGSLWSARGWSVLCRSKPCAPDSKWTRYPAEAGHEAVEGPLLGDFFEIKRGLATGNNSYFILPAEEIERRELPMEAFLPILPSPRYVPDDEVSADEKGNPVLKRQAVPAELPAGGRRDQKTVSQAVGLSRRGQGAGYPGTLSVPPPHAVVLAGGPTVGAVRLYLPRPE